MNPKVTLWCAAVSGAAAILLGTSAAADMFHPAPPKPSPPGKDELAIGRFQCTQPAGGTEGFLFLSFSGTTGISSPSLQGQFTTDAGTATPVTCPGLAQQVAADAAAGGCTVGPIGTISSFGDPEVTVHFACSGGHDSVVGAIAAVSRSIAGATLSGAVD